MFDALAATSCIQSSLAQLICGVLSAGHGAHDSAMSGATQVQQMSVAACVGPYFDIMLLSRYQAGVNVSMCVSSCAISGPTGPDQSTCC